MKHLRAFAIILFSLGIVAMIMSMVSCEPTANETIYKHDTVYVPQTITVHLPAKLDSVFNKDRKFGSNTWYYRIHVDTLNLLFTEVEIYNAKVRAAKNKEDVPVKDMATDGPIVQPKPFKLTGGALPAVTGQHTLRSDCLTCHK